MSFFYDLNKKLDSIRATPEVTHQQLNERDMSRAAKGYEKYGKEGMEALAKAGREGEDLDPVRKKYDKYDNTEVDEGVMDTVNKVGKKVAGGINRLVGHGSDEDMRNDLKRKAGVPTAAPKQTPMDPKDEYDYFTGRDKVRGGEQQVKEKLSPAKQKSFAALAPPADKITFADKIAGAKKEVDEMLGDVAAEAMRKALGGGKGRNAEMDEERSKGTAFDMSTRKVDTPKAGSTERGNKHDITHSTSDPRYKGRTVTRRTDAQGISVPPETDEEGNQKEKRTKSGRPDGTGKKTGAKGPSGKSKLMTKEGADQGQAQQVVDDLAELRAAAKQAQRGGEFPQGFASRLEVTLYAAMTLIKNQQPGDAQVREEEPIAEKAVSKQQQKFMGMAHAMQKGEKVKGASKELKKVASTMKPKDTEDFAKTKHKGLPDKAKSKKKEEDVEESTTAGSVATSSASKGGGAGMVGKGIYDSMNRELENMIAESMTVNMSDSTEGGKSLTITATDEDALKLGMLLKNAGLGGGDAHGGDMHSHDEQPCATCGMPDCGCGDVQEAVDENAPDYPTNTEQADNNFGYAGGLDGPKSTGQSTVPVLASQDERQHSYAAEEEDAIKRMMEMAGLAEGNMPMVKKDGKMVPAFAADGKGKNDLEDKSTDKDKEEDTVEESIRRMMEIAGVKKKPMDEEKTDEGNKFAFNVLKAKEAGKKEADLDGDGDMEKVRESIFALDNQWRAYKG